MYKLMCSNARMDLVYFHFRKALEKNGGGAYLRMKYQLHVPLVTLSYSSSFPSNNAESKDRQTVMSSFFDLLQIAE